MVNDIEYTISSIECVHICLFFSSFSKVVDEIFINVVCPICLIIVHQWHEKFRRLH